MNQLTLETFVPLLPLILTSVTVVMVMLAIAIRRHHWWNATLSVIGLNLALISTVWLAFTHPPQLVTTLLLVDGYAYFYMALILVSTLACCSLSYSYIRGYKGNKEELYLLMLIAAAGALVMVCSIHMASFFIGLELLSVPVYGMIAYTHQRSRSLEGGIKYMVLSAAASAIILFGMALLYTYSGTLSFAGMGEYMSTETHNPVAVAGITLIVIGVAFKLSLAPFHLWTPDVYEGAPAPVGAFIATVSKIAVFALLVRWLVMSPYAASHGLSQVLSLLAVLSIVIGNLLALTQNNIKRMMGYSSIAHFGYLLIALVVLTGYHVALTIETINIYLLSYVLTTLGVFGVISIMSSPYAGDDADGLFNYRGLFWRHPYMTGVMVVMMLSLAGIPLTAGFIGKFYVVLAGVLAGQWGLLAALIFGSALGLYYYLHMMIAMFMAAPGLKRHDATPDWGQRASGVIVVALACLVLFIGVYPQPALVLARLATAALVH